MFSALADVDWKMKQMGPAGGVMYCFDVKSAFGSVNRMRAFHDLKAKMPDEIYLDKLFNCYNKTKMNVDLGFMTVDGIKILKGYPEGCSVGANLYIITMASVIKYVLDRYPEAQLVLYSDDVCAICRDTDELERVHTLLCEGLAYFGLRFDGSKACFIRFGTYTVDEITLTSPDGTVSTVKHSDAIR